MPQQEYSWKRFWCPQGVPINLSDEGYLYDPETEIGRWLNPYIVSLDEIKNMPCLMLLGEPGMGKSRALKTQQIWLENNTSRATDSILAIDLRAYQSEDRLYRAIFEHSLFRAWVEGTHRLHLFLDSLDEGLLRINAITAFLGEELQNCANERLFFRVACRTAEWPRSLETILRKIWGDDAALVYELAPLRRTDIVGAARMNNLNPDTLLAEIDKVRAVPLAIKPITLEFLINKFRATGTLPSRQVDLYRDGLLLLCEESNEERRDAKLIGTYSARQRMSIAAQIAGVTVFANRYAIWTDVDRGDVPMEDVRVQDVVDVQADGVLVSEIAVRETLATGLFSARGPKRLGWAHQTYAEFLAAFYLVERQVPMSEILHLIVHPDGKLIPQLYQTVAWLAGMHSEIFSEVMRIDPEVLVRSDIAVADPQTRERLVTVLLELHDKQALLELDWGNQRQLRKLAHPNLSQQIKPYILDRTKNIHVRRFAIDLAEACGMDGLGDSLVALCLDSSEDLRVRTGAADAIYKTGRDEVKAQLRPLITEEIGNDPYDELKGYALLSLWPKHITAKELFEVLTLPKHENFFGAYHLFLSPRNSVDHLQVHDLLLALAWVEKQPHALEQAHALRDVIDTIMLKAWYNLDEPGVLQPFAKAVLSRLLVHDAIVGEGSKF